MSSPHPRAITHALMVLRVCRELRDGMVVNLGLGIPTLLADVIPHDIDVLLHAENGVLGYGPYARPEEEDRDTINPGGARVTLCRGASFFDSAESFALVRGGHVDLAVLGAMQVAENGDLANWMVPDRGLGGIGGAMDLVAGARRVIAVMEHTTRDGRPKLLPHCTYPLTGKRAVHLVVTDLAVVEIGPAGFVLREVAPGVSPADVQALSAAELTLSPDLCEMRF